MYFVQNKGKSFQPNYKKFGIMKKKYVIEQSYIRLYISRYFFRWFHLRLIFMNEKCGDRQNHNRHKLTRCIYFSLYFMGVFLLIHNFIFLYWQKYIRIFICTDKSTPRHWYFYNYILYALTNLHLEYILLHLCLQQKWAFIWSFIIVLSTNKNQRSVLKKYTFWRGLMCLYVYYLY